MITKREVKERFEVVSASLGGIGIILDKQTGVQYLSTAGGLTPLLGADGKPVIHHEDKNSAF
ncbi:MULTISPECIES: DUF6440 family protein [unclassified Lactococcus]|uniref:DUF6440 family protein n=1 Tax=unclassified Lactococcus TaxID=2643510 RepID=UPI0011CAE37A|nr:MULTISPECIES: DUF6440 family protein [unclassified Lactococcus]MQW23274.1 hypothetical protein [Lactococcus sp. dk101]TXK38059.1 hypothetical protein FVP42_06510 [Lactococcus sp. dk310]TXK49738.1 hypothetical protein FVP43_06480 [Lactococcus sp. dk322]